AGVADAGGEHAGLAADEILHAPEATAGQDGGLRAGRTGDGSGVGHGEPSLSPFRSDALSSRWCHSEENGKERAMDAEETAAEEIVGPRIVGDALGASSADAGSVWRLEPAERGLDANVIMLPPGDEIRAHTGPELDVLIV